MKTYYIVLLFLICLVGIELVAQDASPIDPTVALCKPGVENKAPSKGLQLEYGWNTTNLLGTAVLPTLSTISDIKDVDRIKAKLKIPILNKTGLKFLLGLEHFREGYQLTSWNINSRSAIESYEKRTLKSSRLSAYLIKSLDQKNYLAFQFAARYNGDYNGLINFNNNYAAYRFGGVWGLKINNRKEFGFGIAASIRPDRWSVFPFLNYNQTFNDKWGIEATLPVKIALRRNFNDKNLALLGVNFASRDFALHAFGADLTSDENLYVLDRQELNFFVDIQSNAGGWIWVRLKTGYQLNTQMEFFHHTDRNTNFFPTNAIGGAFINFGIFIAPPKSYFK